MKRRSTVAGNFGWLLCARFAVQMQGGPIQAVVAVLVYKLLRAAEWAAFDTERVFAGSPDDRRDGYIHLSTAGQVAATAAKYFAGDAGTMLVTLDGDALGPALRWEPSRGGALFPHLYRPLARDEVVSAVPFDPAADLH